MAELAELPALETLDLTHSKLSNSGLAGLEKLSHVRALDLGSCQVSDAGMEHVAQVKSLWFLSLSFTRVTDQELEALKGLNQLKALNVGRTKISRAGIERLRKAWPNVRVGN
ncbi:MAG: hypothetical protein WA746_27900 [Isosphaeraceae bacterium]